MLVELCLPNRLAEVIRRCLPSRRAGGRYVQLQGFGFRPASNPKTTWMRATSRACAVTSAIARSALRVDRAWCSSIPFLGIAACVPRIALVELVALGFLAWLRSIVRCDKRLQRAQQRLGHRHRIDLLAGIEKPCRLAIAQCDQQRSSGRLITVFGWPPHHERLRISGSQIEVVALGFGPIKFDRQAAKPPPSISRIISDAARDVFGIVE